MNKKFLSLVLALVMVLGTFSSVFAAPAEKKETKEAPKAAETVVPKITGKKAKIQWLQDNKYVEGRKVNKDPKNNDLALDKNIQRDEVSKLLVYAIGRENLANKIAGTFKPYSDVDNKHWANGFITVGSTEKSPANELAFLIGYPDKTFKPANNVTYAELSKMLVTLAKTDLTKDMHDKANKDWPRQWMAWAAEMGILEDVDVKNSNDPAVREDAFTMIYNAMYKLKYIKKMPSNETRGIISQIKNGEITVNQGEKAKTIKLMPNTTFVLYNRSYDVNASKAAADRVVMGSVLSNPSYYYGSFVRVLTNDKGEATHVLELGNPAQLALGVGIEPWFGDNSRWADVAEKTAETRPYTEVKNNKGDVLNTYKQILAKVNYKDSDAKSISFFEINSPTARDVEKLNVKLTAETKYYVADVVKNQLTEVKSVDEALRIVGNELAANYIDRVYVGYNTIDGRDARETSKHTAIAGYNEATVVVFNHVQKDNNNAQLLRVKNEATRLYDVTFEDVKGTEIMGNLISYRGAFPFSFKDGKYNVVKITNNNATGIGIKLMIERNDTNKYPVVEVTDIQNNGRSIIVKDSAGHSAVLNIASGADTFLEGQLRVGAKIQFHTLADNAKVKDVNDVNKTNVIDIISVLPNTTKLEGVVQTVAEHNQGNQFYADEVRVVNIKDVDTVQPYHQVDVNQYRYIYNEKSGIERESIYLTHQDAQDLKAWIEANGGKTDIRYNLRDVDTHNRVVAYDVKVFYNNDWYLVADAIAQKAADEQKEALDAFNKEVAKLPAAKEDYKDDKALTDANVAAEKKKVADLKTKFEGLKTDKLKAEDVKKAKDALNKAIKAFNDAAAQAKTDGKVTTEEKIDEVK